jgi:hypothetical protein
MKKKQFSGPQIEGRRAEEVLAIKKSRCSTLDNKKPNVSVTPITYNIMLNNTVCVEIKIPSLEGLVEL